MTREKLFSVTINDCTVQTFRGSGAGGQNRNKRDTAVRVIHEPSGARGESQEERSQHQNKRTAFIRMVETPVFKAWVSAVASGLKTASEIEAEVARELADPSLTKTEIKAGKDRWQEVTDLNELR